MIIIIVLILAVISGIFMYNKFQQQELKQLTEEANKLLQQDLINDEIDKLRHSATASLFETKDVIIVASVSCIYGLRRSNRLRTYDCFIKTWNEKRKR